MFKIPYPLWLAPPGRLAGECEKVVGGANKKGDDNQGGYGICLFQISAFPSDKTWKKCASKRREHFWVPFVSDTHWSMREIDGNLWCSVEQETDSDAGDWFASTYMNMYTVLACVNRPFVVSYVLNKLV